MKPLSVIELAKLYKLNRQTIYKRIKKGDLSKNSDGKIDLAEAIRVFGNPSKAEESVTKLHVNQEQKLAEVDTLKQQVDILKNQLSIAQEREKRNETITLEREKFYQDQIEAMQRLLMAPKSKIEEPQSFSFSLEDEKELNTNHVITNVNSVDNIPEKNIKSILFNRLLKIIR